MPLSFVAEEDLPLLICDESRRRAGRFGLGVQSPARVAGPGDATAEGRRFMGTSDPKNKRAYRSKPFAFNGGSGGVIARLFACPAACPS